MKTLHLLLLKYYNNNNNFKINMKYFQASWTNASKKQREKLLELIRRLAEDDKDGVMAHKVY